MRALLPVAALLCGGRAEVPGAAYRTFDGGGRGRRAIDRRVEDYLTRFGYLPQSDLETGALRSIDQLQDAVRNLQGFAGLELTGQVDGPTRELLASARCGVQDVSLGYRNRRAVRVRRYNLQGQRWGRANLTWSLRTAAPAGLARETARRELTTALHLWQRYTKLTFTETRDDEKADIQARSLHK
jgi:hypothetical protein